MKGDLKLRMKKESETYFFLLEEEFDYHCLIKLKVYHPEEAKLLKAKDGILEISDSEEKMKEKGKLCLTIKGIDQMIQALGEVKEIYGKMKE
jgi:hypothetical protein